MTGVIFVYLGFIAGVCGLLSFLKPFSGLGIHTRLGALYLLIAALLLVVLGWTLPAREVRVDPPRTLLDQFVPLYQFNEFHSIQVKAPKERTYAAIKSVTADEIPFFRTLAWIRRGGRPTPEGILNPSHQPILESAMRTSFLLLAEEPNHEIVMGTAVVVPPGWRPIHKPTPEDFKALHEPGFALAAMDLVVEDTGNGACTVTTETRVYATDAHARHRFQRYWRVIYPGSSLIRYMWLRAIKKKAEATS